MVAWSWVGRVPHVTVLVTGGAGFIGSNLTHHLLAAGFKVRVLDSLRGQVHDSGPRLPDDVEFIQGDVRDANAVKRALTGVDRVVHLAAAVGVGQSMYEIVDYTSSNALGIAVVLEAAADVRDKMEKLVVASSNTIYGEGLYRCPTEDIEVLAGGRTLQQLKARDWEPSCPHCGAALEPLPTPESKPLQPASIYAIGKRDHEEMALVWGRAYGVATTALRFFSVYGRGQALSNPYTGAVAIFASRMLNERKPVVFEDGRQMRDMVHVSDAVAALMAALDPDRGDGSSINIGTGVPTTVTDIADTLSRHLQIDVGIDLQNTFRAGDVRHCFADIALARDVLAFEPQMSFDDGIRDLAGWLVEQVTDTERLEVATTAMAERGLTL